MNKIDKDLLIQIADMHEVPQGSFNIRKNGASIGSSSSEEITIIPKKDKSGIDVFVKENLKNKSIHLPVIITEGNFTDLVYNDFYIGKNSEVTIVAGCGIHNATTEDSRHDGIHTFHLETGCNVKYIEKHLGVGDNSGGKILNPTTVVNMHNNSFMEISS